MFEYIVPRLFSVALSMSLWKKNKCIGDDTKAADRQSLNCIKNKYGEKRFSIWRMEFLHPAMWHVALGWHATKFVKTSAILEFYIWFPFPHITAVDMSFCTSLRIFFPDHPRQEIMTSCRFSRWRISAILDYIMNPIIGSVKSPCATSYRSLIATIALHCLVFENRKSLFLHFGDRQTD